MSRAASFATIVVLAFALRWPAMNDRFFSNDEATYSALAAKLLTGGSMYVDAVDHKPPAIVWLYARAFRVAGLYQLQWIRVLLALIVGFTGCLLGELAVGLTGDPRARAAGIIYILVSATGFAPNTQAANTELMLNAPLALAAAAVVWSHREERLGRVCLLTIFAGAATGAAALFKYQAALAGVAWLLSLGACRSLKQVATSAAGLAMGFAIIAAALIGTFALSGHLDAFLFWGWRYNFQYIAAVPFERQLVRFVTETLPIAAVWSPAMALAAFAGRRLTMGWLWGAAMAAAVCIGGRFFGNYFLMIAPPLSLLAGAGVAALFATRPRLTRALAAALVVLATASTVAAQFWDRLSPSTARMDAQYRAAGAWIREHSRPDDRLLVWGDSAQIYVYAQRVMGTRFAFCNYHTGAIWGTGAMPGREDIADATHVVPRAWRELLDDMRRSPPMFVADAAAAGLHNFSRQEELQQYPELWKTIARDYRYAATEGGIPIYRRVAP